MAQEAHGHSLKAVANRHYCMMMLERRGTSRAIRRPRSIAPTSARLVEAVADKAAIACGRNTDSHHQNQTHRRADPQSAQPLRARELALIKEIVLLFMRMWFEYSGTLHEGDPDASANVDVSFQGFLDMLAEQAP